MSDGNGGDGSERLRRSRWLFVGGSIGAATLAVFVERGGGALEHALLAADVLIICAWITLGRPSLELAVASVATITIAFGWLGGTPEPTLFQPILLAAGVGWRMPGFARSLAFAGLLASAPLLGDLGPRAGWGWWNWSIGTGFAWTMGRIIRRLDRALAELGEARARLVTAAAMDERRRIARDVHDLVGHSLTAMLLNIRAARQSLASDPRGAERALDDAVRIGRAGLADVRSSVLVLRETVDGDSPGEGAVLSVVPDGQAIVELLERRTDVRVSIDGAAETLRGPIAAAIFRILQECLTNITRHAGAGSATLTLRVDDAVVALRAENAIGGGERSAARADTVRPDARAGAEARATLGLIGMRERVVSLGGRFDAGRSGERWRVECEIPRR